MNSVHPRHDPSRFAQLTHFVFSFHDDTLEVVAADARVVNELSEGTDIVARMRQVLLRPPSNKPVQPTRAAEPIGQREPAQSGPRG